MVMPNLLHPIPIKISQIDEDETHYDNDAKEPVKIVQRKSEKIVQGQVKWFGDEKVDKQVDGNIREKADGYVLFRYVDLAFFGIDLKRGDKLTLISGINTDVRVVKLQPMGHYPTENKTLVRAYFETR